MTAGPLILAGGAEFDERMAAADRAWLAAMRIARPRVGVFPTANTEHPEQAAANGVRHFRTLDTLAETVMATSKVSASEPAVLDQVRNLDFAYFAGGEPLYLAQTLGGAALWDVLIERWRSGMGLGGSSAGAMVLCRSIFLRDHWSEGLGIVPGVVCLPHFDHRDEAAAERARAAVSEHGLVGLGIDESTALVWTAQAGWCVAGPGRVVVLTAAGATAYRDGSAPEDVPAPVA